MNSSPADFKGPQPQSVFVACAPGLEPMLTAELSLLQIPAQQVAGGAECQTDLAGIYRILYGVGLGLRVLLRLTTFRAVRFAQLEREFKALPWGRYLPTDQEIQLRATARKSRLYHSKAVAERLQLVLAEQVGARPAAEGAQGDSNLRLQVRMDQDLCTVSLELTGRVFHQRGYRLNTVKAPLRADLARALLLCTGYTGEGPLIDPLCGSGTLPIEAALLASGRAPGQGRSFAIERLPFAQADLAQRVCAELNARGTANPTPPPIWGSDRDAGAIAAATANLDRVDLGPALRPRFEQRPISAVELPAAAGPGLIIANPPYGQRLGNRSRLKDLYAALGALRRRAPDGYRLALVTSNPELSRAVGLPLESRLLTDNGGIKVRFYVEPKP